MKFKTVSLSSVETQLEMQLRMILKILNNSHLDFN
jgi:hypothetical protein